MLGEIATAARAMGAVLKPHVPSIRFRYGKQNRINNYQVSPAVSVPATPSSNSGSIGKLKGPSIEFEDLPQRYHRKPLTVEEMEYIERGGPE